MNTLLTASYEFDLPERLIASHPAGERTESRLLVVDPSSGTLRDGKFKDLAMEFRAGDVLVVNNARVMHARLLGRRPTGGTVELFVLGFERPGYWTDESTICCFAKPGRGLRPGTLVTLSHGFVLEFVDREGSENLFRFKVPAPGAGELLNTAGHVPLPPYIRKRRLAVGEPEESAADTTRYQTVFAREAGAVAAPTAGLHFDREFLAILASKGVVVCDLTLFVGAGTFQPVQTERLDTHPMHEERYDIPVATAEAINAARKAGGRVVAVGTTVVRTLESAVDAGGEVRAGPNATSIFLRPGSEFRVVDAIVTNFHLPRSTLIALVAGFAGYRLTMEAYRYAVQRQYRFYSYGDAMFLRNKAACGLSEFDGSGAVSPPCGDASVNPVPDARVAEVAHTEMLLESQRVSTPTDGK